MIPRAEKPVEFFPETAAGAVVMIPILFLSLPALVGSLVLLGIAKLLSRSRASKVG